MSEMKTLMEVWRKKVLEPYEQEQEKEQELTVDVEAVPGEFQPGDKVEIDVVDDEEEDPLEEEDKEYPSWKKRKRKKRMGMPEDDSWLHGYDQLKALGRGIVRADEAKKKPVKKNCHAYQPYHSADDGQFVDPDKEKGSYSMAAPDSDSSDDCSWGKSSRKSANRSRQAVKQPCGRDSKYRCKDGSPKWESQQIEEDQLSVDSAYLRGIISQELQKAIAQQMQRSGCTFQALVKALNMYAAAEKGELFGKKKKGES